MHHRSKKFNTGRKGAQCFVAIWLLHHVAKVNMRRIVAGFFGNFAGKNMRNNINVGVPQLKLFPDHPASDC